MSFSNRIDLEINFSSIIMSFFAETKTTLLQFLGLTIHLQLC